MAVKTAETDIIVLNYQAYAEAMFGPNSAYSKAKAEIVETFDNFGLINEESGKILAQTLGGMATQANSDALRSAQSTLTLAEDIKLKQAQTLLVARQKDGYDDNLALKIVEHQAGVTQFAVNAGDADTIQQTVAILNSKIKQVEDRIDGLVPVDPASVVYEAPASLAVASITATTAYVSWDALPAGVVADEYVLFVDGVARAGTGLLYASLDGLTTGTKYALNVQSKVAGINTRMSSTVTFTTL